MTQQSPQRNRWVTKDGEKELTYIGRAIDNVYRVEALVIRVGSDKIAYLFLLPDSATADPLAFAGREPQEIIRCEFGLTKVSPTDNVATLVNARGESMKAVDLSTDWYSEL